MIDVLWETITSATHELVMQGQETPLWPVLPGSQLFAADQLVAPWSISDAARCPMQAALDQLHALCLLTMGTDLLHVNALYTLARGCLESAAVALWITSPTDSTIRIERALQWYAADFRDFDRALADIGGSPSRPLADRLGDLREVAASAGCSGRGVEPLNLTQILREADGLLPPDEARILYLWRVCSGFAHGRRWSTLVLAENEHGADTDGTYLTNSLDRILAPTLAAFNLLDLAIRTFKEVAK